MRRLAVLLIALLLAGCSDAEPPPLPDGPVRPPLWVVYDNDTRIVLVAAVHQLPAGLSWTGGRLATEIGIADELLLELSPEQSAAAPALFAALAADEPVPGVAARFGTRAGPLLDLLDDFGIDEAEADRLESWALALQAGNALTRRSGLSTSEGVEAVLAARFADSDRPVGGLETARQQLILFDDLAANVQDRMVLAVLDDAADAAPRTRRLLTAWASGDVDALATIADEAMAPTPMLVEPLVHARNRAWADTLARRMNRPGSVMVAVGTGHLVGEASLIAELRARGLRPMRLQ